MSLATEDKSCPVEGIGTLRFRVKYKGSFHEITLTDVLFNPKLRRNLLSGSRLENKGAHFVGTKVKTSKNDSVKGLPRLTDNGKTHCIPCKLAKPKRVSFKKMGAVRSKRPLELLHMDLCGPMPTESQGGNKYFLSIIDDYSRKVTVFPIRNKSDVFHTFIRFQKRAERFLSKRQKVNSNLGYNLNLPDYYDDEDDSDRVKDSLTSRLVSKTSVAAVAEWYRHRIVAGFVTSSSPVPLKTRRVGKRCTLNLSRAETSSRWCGVVVRRGVPAQVSSTSLDHGSKLRGPKDNTESQGFSDLSEQQEALMVEVTIPNGYKQAIRSRDASKWHDAMDKEINVMMERKVWDLVDHPDNIKILENRWVYTIKYDENNKIVRYKARLVARGNTQLRGESFDEVFQEYQLELSKVKSLKLRCYSDSDFATNRDDRVSMGGFITFIDETPISWRTCKQKSVSLSTMEAEYVSLTEAAKEFIWLKNVIDNKSLNLEL
ncbi:retrovirus-related Pol polyprotein from transposon RE1 [Trichonephila clavipes]|nr:retrovirus-related Pol polyprotein from transposon RE1 [Trichonephila clavipes]